MSPIPTDGPYAKRRVLQLAALAVSSVAALACGRSPVAGLEGELCGSDDDCSSGLVCERRVCLSLDRFDTGTDVPAHTGEFFAVLHLERWDGAEGDAIRELGRFLGDLSTIRSPYYGIWAITPDTARFGRLDPNTAPLDFAASGTVTEMDLEQDDIIWRASANVLFMPAVYSDASVSLDFDIPLQDGRVVLAVNNGSEPGVVASMELEGALRLSDAQDLIIERPEDSFSLYDVLRNEPLTVDTDADGLADAWQLRWEGTAQFE